jgi:hypothetical protein
MSADDRYASVVRILEAVGLGIREAQAGLAKGRDADEVIQGVRMVIRLLQDCVLPELAGRSGASPAAPNPGILDYCVSIGSGAVPTEYGDIVFATDRGVELRLRRDGIVSINNIFIGQDSELYDCFRNCFGYPLPGVPRNHKGEKAFIPFIGEGRVPNCTLPQPVRRPQVCSVVVMGDYVPVESDNGCVIFKNLVGDVFKISPSMVLMDTGWCERKIRVVCERNGEVMDGLRHLMRLPRTGTPQDQSDEATMGE